MMNIHSHVVIPVDEYEKMVRKIELLPKLTENPKEELSSRVRGFLQVIAEEVRKNRFARAEQIADYLESESHRAAKWMWENALYEAGIDPKKLP